MSATVRPDQCRRCKAPIVVGDCARTHVETRADVGPLSVPGQALAVLTRRCTFRLVRTRGRWVVSYREPAEIVCAIETGLGPPVLVWHVCGAPLPTLPGPSALELIAPPDLSVDDLAVQLGMPVPDLPPPF